MLPPQAPDARLGERRRQAPCDWAVLLSLRFETVQTRNPRIELEKSLLQQSVQTVLRRLPADEPAFSGRHVSLVFDQSRPAPAPIGARWSGFPAYDGS